MASKNFYKILLANDVRKSKEAMAADYEREAGDISGQANRGKIGGTIGGLLGQFGVPALLGVLGVATGGVGLLAISALGAAAGAYAGNKLGQELGDKADASSIEKQKFGSETLSTYRGEVDSALDDIETQAKIGALKTGAAVGAQGIMMGADKYANYVQNPMGHYFKSFRNPAQLAADKEAALAGLTPGSDAYNAALAKHTDTAASNIVKGSNKTSVLDLVQQTPSTDTVATAKDMSLIDTGLNQHLDDLIASQSSQSSVASQIVSPGPSMPIHQVSYDIPSNINPGDPLYKSLLAAIQQNKDFPAYITPGIHNPKIKND